MATITQDNIDQIIDASLNSTKGCLSYEIRTERGDIQIHDFTDTSAKVSFSSLGVSNKTYMGVMTLSLIDGRWQSALTVADDEAITETGSIPTPASQKVIDAIALTVSTAVSFWYVANPERIKLRELQIIISDKQQLEELAIATINKLKKVVKSKPEIVEIDTAIAECSENRERIALIKDKDLQAGETRKSLGNLISTLLEKNSRE